MLEVGLILWPVVQKKWKENVGGESKEGAQRLLYVTTYDSRLLPLWFTAGTHSKGKTTHFREA